jgi:hypothetical protein
LNDLQQLFIQATPWGLTVGQTVVVLLIATGLVVGWTMLRSFLRLTATIFQIGCAALLVFICGITSFMVFYNFASR